MSTRKILSKREADAMQRCVWMSDRELATAYSGASMQGDRELVDVYFREIERRHAQQLGSMRLPTKREG